MDHGLERRFFGLEYRKKTFYCPILHKKKSSKNGHFWKKRHFPGVYCLKKKVGKFLDQNHELTPLEKCQFFNLLNLLFL